MLKLELKRFSLYISKEVLVTSHIKILIYLMVWEWRQHYNSDIYSK